MKKAKSNVECARKQRNKVENKFNKSEKKEKKSHEIELNIKQKYVENEIENNH